VSDKKKNKMSDNEKVLLRADYLKTWITTLLGVVAGEVALINTFYKDADYLWLLFISVSFFILAIIFLLGAYEALVNKAAGVPSTKGYLLGLLIHTSPKTEILSWGLSSVSGVLIGLGLGVFGGFIIFT